LLLHVGLSFLLLEPIVRWMRLKLFILETRNPYLSQYMARGNCHDKKPMVGTPAFKRQPLFFFTPMTFIICHYTNFLVYTLLIWYIVSVLHLFKNIHTSLVLLLDLVKRIHTILLGYWYWILFKNFHTTSVKHIYTSGIKINIILMRSLYFTLPRVPARQVLILGWYSLASLSGKYWREVCIASCPYQAGTGRRLVLSQVIWVRWILWY
jgi:hypothetical protein